MIAAEQRNFLTVVQVNRVLQWLSPSERNHYCRVLRMCGHIVCVSVFTK